MEVGMTRWITEKTKATRPGTGPLSRFLPLSEQMSIEEMILGYTINGAKQLGIDAAKGSIEAGKDADFLVFDGRPAHGGARGLQLQQAAGRVFLRKEAELMLSGVAGCRDVRSALPCQLPLVIPQGVSLQTVCASL